MALYEGERNGVPGGLPAGAYGAGNSSINYSDPAYYMESAKDISEYNTETSQALAREQMAFQERANARAMVYNATEAQKNRDWQELMSSTAHQREVRDLLAAGLNPILSANAGAATPSGSAAQGVTSSGSKGNVDVGAMNALINLYTQAYQMKMQDKQIDANLAMNMLNNETTRYAADRGAVANMTAASMTAGASRLATETNKWLYENNYMGTDKMLSQFVGAFVNSALDVAGSEDPFYAIGKTLSDTFPVLGKLWNSMFNVSEPKPGRTSQKPIRTRGSSDGERTGGYRTSE